MKLEILHIYSKNNQIWNFMKVHIVGLSGSMQLDKQLDMTKLIVPFHNLGNVCNKNGIIKLRIDCMGQIQDNTYLLFI